jgi:sec-independent protein translocase protein TatA
LAFLDFLGVQGFLILAILGLLLYGERLPEVAASLGKQLVQLKKSMEGIRNEIQSVAFDAKNTITNSIESSEDYAREEATAPKFEPPPYEASYESVPALSASSDSPASPDLPAADKS